MSNAKEPKTKSLTEPELAYFRGLNNAAVIALQCHQEAQQRLAICLTFLRDQHDAPENKWKMEDLNKGFVQIKFPLKVKE